MESPIAAPTEPAATMAAQSGLEPFRLMDLPTELRLMIYKRLPRQIKHTELRYHLANCFDTDKIDSIILVTRHLPTALLRTSREIYAEAHDIVAALIRTFVKESQPRVIEHDSYVQMLDVLRAVTTERERLAPGRSCDMVRVSQRHPEFVYHPEETEPPREVTQFICQATLATSNPIAIISCVDFDSTADHCRLVREAVRRKIVINTTLRRSYRPDPCAQVDETCMVLHAPDGEIKLTATNTPAKLDWRELYESNCFNDVPTTHISQETWVEEWLPSM
ncbi:unnamed protein product [Alternaria burnsii]|nr:unnamed protein product [Alternaria burnsii]